MNRMKLLGGISIALLLINLFLVWQILSHNSRLGRKEEPKKVIIKRLDLDDKQVEEYEKLINWHKEKIHIADDQMMAIKNELYSSLQNGKQTSSNDSLINSIGQLQMSIEQINYKHFQDIRNLCRPDQQKLFDSLSGDITKLFATKKLPMDAKK
ncbi:MAG: hypothetical protein ABI851_07490 [Saprospiraceae bacterium]